MKPLTTSMKPSKRRSIENQVKKSPVAVQMLNILDGKKARNPVSVEKKTEEGETCQPGRGRITRQKAMVKLTANTKVSINFSCHSLTLICCSYIIILGRQLLFPLCSGQILRLQHSEQQLQFPGGTQSQQLLNVPEVRLEEAGGQLGVFNSSHTEDLGVKV